LLGQAYLPLYIIFGILSGFFALGTGVYGGFIMNYVKGIPFWNSGLIPVVFIIAGVADGFGLIMGIGLAGGDASIATAEMWSRIFLITNAFIITVLLVSANYISATAKLSVKEIIVGRVALAFWLGIVVLGILVPFAVSVSSLFLGEASAMILLLAIGCHTLGAFALKYCLLKAGIYRPLLPRIAAY
jgi:formate-dependent nitrite reductase membrane component NrfD